MKICVIGPTYPFRGGIAHFTTMLVTHLRKNHEVALYSFSRQYPRWLFPGSVDRDPSVTVFEVECKYLLDPLCPRSWISTFMLLKEQQLDLLILQWWVPFWTPTLATISYMVKQFTTTKILFICHHIAPPDKGPFDLLLAKPVLRQGDYFITMSDEDTQALQKIVPGARFNKVFIPTYDIFAQLATGSFMVQNGWQIDRISDRVILFFGFVRRYKGLRYLLEAISQITPEIPVSLLIVGEFWECKNKYVNLIKKLGISACVKIIDKYIPNEEVANYFTRADVVVLPYLEATQSGVIQLAYSFNKPVITTSVGGLAEVVEHDKTGFVVPPRNSRALAIALSTYFTNGCQERFSRAIQAQHSRFRWSHFVDAIEELLC